MASDPRAGADVASHQREEGGSLFDGAVAFQEALHAVAGMKLEGPLPKPMCVRKPPGPLKACGLPLRRLSDHGTKLVTFVDILIDQPPFDWDKLEEECLRSNYDALPEALTLGAKPGIPYTMQVFVVPDGLEEAATCTVVKHVCFRPNKVHLDTIRRLRSTDSAVQAMGFRHAPPVVHEDKYRDAATGFHTNDAESENLRVKRWSRHRYGRLSLSANDMDEYVFYINVGEGMAAVMKGLAMSNGMVVTNAFL